MLQFTERYVRLLISEGKLPAIRIGQAYRVDEAELDAYLEEVKVQTPTPAGPGSRL